MIYSYNLLFYGYRDRFRTTVNVLGDSFGARIVERLSRKQLASQVVSHGEALNGGSDDIALYSAGSSHDSNGNKCASNSLTGVNDSDEEIMELHNTNASTPLHDTTKL